MSSKALVLDANILIRAVLGRQVHGLLEQQACKAFLHVIPTASWGPCCRSLAELLHLYRILYILTMAARRKPIEFRSASLDDLRAFPVAARHEAGHQLDQVQQGLDPDDWRPMTTVGQGVREIRIRDTSGAFRIIYVAKFANIVYVLHCFQKKSRKTSKMDLDVATKRYRELVTELGR